MVMPLRVGDSFVADVNNFAQAAIYAIDNGVLVIQEALGTLNNSTAGARGRRTTPTTTASTVIASAADEAAQHHNWPSSLPHVIVVNSVTEVRQRVSPAAVLPRSSTAARTSAPTSPRDPELELLLERDRHGVRASPA